MRRVWAARHVLTALLAAFLLVGTSATGVFAATDVCARADACVNVISPLTLPGAGGREWVDGHGGVHGRNIPIDAALTDTFGEPAGTLHYDFSFNLSADGSSSTAWCDFTMDLSGYGALSGRCNGTLLAGQIVGQGNAVGLHGTYVLEQGGYLGLGPYDLQLGLSFR